jgi:hypothetical protein
MSGGRTTGFCTKLGWVELPVWGNSERSSITRLTAGTRRNRSFVGRGEPAPLADSAIRGRDGHRPDQQPVVAVSITV